jgi:Amt family ammonium transporter
MPGIFDKKSKAAVLAAGAVLMATACFGQDAAAAGAQAVSNGDNAWVLISAALVMFMTPGLAFFYGGLVRKKNVLSILIQCFIIMCLVSVQWVVFGYSLAFGPDVKGLVGSLKWFGLNGVGLVPNPDYAATIPHQTFMIFQGMFAVITPALILGAFAERMRFGAFVIFSLAWSFLVYDPVCHWVWGAGGFLRELGALDFAGGIVVHVNAGMAALAAALALGRRHGYPNSVSPPHSLPFAVLGAGILWFGWFGFNAGSALGAGTLATSAFVATNTAGAAAGLVWALLDWIFNSRATVLGLITGAVAGHAAVTPAAGFVGVPQALLIGAVASLLCYVFVTFLKPRLGYDDSLDAFGVHGISGIWGSLALGLFASRLVNPAGADGLFAGNPALFWAQLKAVGVVAAYAFTMSFVILKLVDWTVRLRIGQQEEKIGLDLIEHRETGYTVLE